MVGIVEVFTSILKMISDSIIVGGSRSDIALLFGADYSSPPASPPEVSTAGQKRKRDDDDDHRDDDGHVKSRRGSRDIAELSSSVPSQKSGAKSVESEVKDIESLYSMQGQVVPFSDSGVGPELLVAFERPQDQFRIVFSITKRKEYEACEVLGGSGLPSPRFDDDGEVLEPSRKSNDSVQNDDGMEVDMGLPLVGLQMLEEGSLVDAKEKVTKVMMKATNKDGRMRVIDILAYIGL
jgi:hypothetical protein